MMTGTRDGFILPELNDARSNNPEDRQTCVDFDPLDFRFGTDGGDGKDGAIAAFTEILDSGSPATQLTVILDQMAELLIEADVARLCRPPGLLEQYTGRALERQLEHVWARIRLERMVEEADAVARLVERTIEQLDALLAEEDRELTCRRLHLRAGRLHLARFRGIAGRDHKARSLDPARERLQRRLVYLQAAIASMEINAIQLRLARANVADLLARYYEFSRLLLPQWFKQIALLNLNGHNAQDQIKAANDAYQTARARLQNP